MIASVPISTPLSWPSREKWLLAWLEGETIGEALKTVRKDWGRRTPGYLSQLKMAALLEKVHGEYAPSQGTISNIENDLTPIFDLHEQVRLDLLKLYPLTEKQIEELDEKFELNLPLQKTVYLNNSGTTPPDSDIVWFRNIRNAEPGEAVPVRRDSLEGIPEDRFNNLMVAENVLMPPELAGQIVRGTTLFCTPDAKPNENDTLAYKYAGEDRYVVLERKNLTLPTAVVSLDGGQADVIKPDDPRLEFLGITLVEARSRRTRFGTIVGTVS